MTEWRIEQYPADYLASVAKMEERAAQIRDVGAEDLVWLLEHPSLYTAGTSAKAADLLTQDLPVFDTGRGGEYTYHGPGQRVAYVVTDLQKHAWDKGPDLKKYIWQLEEWMIETLKHFDVIGERRESRVGIWVDMPRHGAVGTESKIAAIGVRVRKWVAYHGVALNVAPDLSHFNGIVPCGIEGFGVTSLAALGRDVSMENVDQVLQKTYKTVF